MFDILAPRRASMVGKSRALCFLSFARCKWRRCQTHEVTTWIPGSQFVSRLVEIYRYARYPNSHQYLAQCSIIQYYIEEWVCVLNVHMYSTVHSSTQRKMDNLWHLHKFHIAYTNSSIHTNSNRTYSSANKNPTKTHWGLLTQRFDTTW